MTPFIKLEAVAVPLLRHNIDTDVLIPMKRLLGTPLHEISKYAFEPLRFDESGAERADCILNSLAFRGARILIAGRNFGCGSSREAAVVGLYGMGFRCIVAPSFGDIFAGNCVKNGLLAITLPESQVKKLATQAEAIAGDKPFSVDLEKSEIRSPDGRVMPFLIDPGDREMMLSGLDEIECTLRLRDVINAFQNRDRARRPWVYFMNDRNEHARRSE